MKYLILIMDGAADYPIEKLNGKTPLQVAKKINIDKLAEKSRCGLLKTIPENFSSGSVVANLSILGYDPEKYFKGRGVLEAAAMGIKLNKNDIAFRCNIINVSENKIVSHSAGHFDADEGKQLIDSLNEKLGRENIEFYSGVDYRHVLVMREKYSEKVRCYPPHDFLGENFYSLLPTETEKEGEETSEILREMIEKSKEILEDHPVNLKREKAGKMKGNLMWPWSPGKKPDMETFQERFNIKGAVISGVDLIKGIGIYCGFEVINVEGATGDYRTNYEGKAQKSIESLKEYDFVYVHVEAPDEASHEGNIELKIKCIEDFDKRLVGNILRNIDISDISIAILPDHYTSVITGKHTGEPVPFLIYKPDQLPDEVKKFDEISCKNGFYKILEGTSFIYKLIS
ncbi:MAG TPA: cofactor-independent phosphoglycerate mutase [bacterium]|nr:cofactor-independent phosphoglycerate mutase [bacterium]